MLSSEYQPISRQDRDAFAAAIQDSGWCVEFHEAPDRETSLMVIPERGSDLRAFVLSRTTRVRLQACRDDKLWDLGEFLTLQDAVGTLRQSMADEVNY